MHIRKAMDSDLEQILKIISPFVSPGFHWPEDLFRSEFATTETWVAEQDSEVRAFICLRDAVEAWEASVLATRQDCHGQGVMEFLLKHVIQRFGERRHIWLEVHEKNVPAQKLYEKLGFVNDGQRGGYYRDGSSALLYSLMKKKAHP